jgi:pseudouridine-5'-phosphate glycosidase
MTLGFIDISDEVSQALAEGAGVVALETTLVAHGFPGQEGLDVALESERQVRSTGAVPATVGVVDGRAVVGLSPGQLEQFTGRSTMAKLGPRDIASCLASGEMGATTVGGTLAVCAAVGISFMGTGGIGGVHRGFAETLDISADLGQIARTRAMVVSSGAKSLLDVAATAELLETLGVPVLGWRTRSLPRFYTSKGGPAVSATVDSAEQAARTAQLHWELAGPAGLVLGQAPPRDLDIEPLMEEAVAAVTASGVKGQAVTPAVLSYLHEASAGETVSLNKELIAANARLAGEVAVAYAKLHAD